MDVYVGVCPRACFGVCACPSRCVRVYVEMCSRDCVRVVVVLPLLFHIFVIHFIRHLGEFPWKERKI